MIILIKILFSGFLVAQTLPPPPSAIEDCKGKKAGDHVSHHTREGLIEASCEKSESGLIARPIKKQVNYNLEQATSDNAQLKTIAFDGLAFITGDFALDTFLPPGKISDYFGFQYMRDNDRVEGGPQSSFLTKIASNMITIMNEEQKKTLLTLAKSQAKSSTEFAEKRFPLIQAFRDQLNSKKILSKKSVIQYSADLYALDGEISYERAKVMASVINNFTKDQKEKISKLKFSDSSTWPDIAGPLDKRSMSHEENVLVMTYASEMFSWLAGSTEADTYFCPERHGMYFGGFGMKTAPAMGKKNYAISTSLTSDSGEAFLSLLTESQKPLISGLPQKQAALLKEIIDVRRKISLELRRFLKNETADKNAIISLSKKYGQFDGEISYLYADAFAKIAKSLTEEQKRKLSSLRQDNPNDPKGPFLFSTPIKMPKDIKRDFLFE